VTGVAIKTLSQSEKVIRGGWGDGQVSVEATVPLAPEPVDGWLVGALPMAMRIGGQLTADAPVDPVLRDNVERAAALLHSWYPRLTVPDIQVASRPGNATPAAGVGCFFSGGVDSFYSALKNRDRITHLIFVIGFDIDVDNTELASEALAGARQAATTLGLPLVEVHTDVRHLVNQHVDWGTEAHGAALAMIGHMLAPALGRVIIPASYHVEHLFPWGSHPQLDPLWNSSKVTFEHHGHHATRPEKVAFIAEQPAAMEHLRVCWENPGNAYNCGRCEKCIRTMINLHVVGAAGRCTTLPSVLDAGAVQRLRLSHGGQVFAHENLAMMKANKVRDPQLRRALRRAVILGGARSAARQARGVLRGPRP